jgi:imidazolonepropionase-like amidohydrolase
VDGTKKMDDFRTSITSIVTTAAEARNIVRSLKQRGADFIKIHSRVPPPAYFAAADEARRQKMTFAGHLPPGVTAIEASDAGQQSIEHIESLMEDVMYLDRSERDKRFQGTLDELAGAKGAAIFKRFVQNGTWIVPTLYTKFKVGGIIFESKFNPVIKALNQAGVGILAGTDFAPKDGGIHPGDLHEELDLLVKGGLTPIQALQSATLNPAKFLNIRHEYGTVEEKKMADLVLLNANPLDDIKNTRNIYAVIVGGRLISKTELQAMITSENR